MAASYRVVSQRQTRDLDAANRLIDIMEVVIVTESGASSAVRIPVAMYQPAVVKTLLDEEAEKLEAIAGLGS